MVWSVKRKFLFFKYLFVAISFILVMSATTHAVIFRDTTGDFNNSDVAAVDTRISNGRVFITILYAEDQIGMTGGVGGNFSIDADQNPLTGGKDTPGFDCRIIYNISRYAPVAHFEFFAGPYQGRTIPIAAEIGNETRLRFDARTVEFSFPASFFGGYRDFDYALFATGMFSSGDNWDRVPDSGVVRCSTGRIIAAPVTGLKRVSQNIVESPKQTGSQPIVRRVTTRMEGDNAIWIIETNKNLPVRQLDFNDSLHFHLMLDIDRRMDTGISNAEIPFLAFGPDCVARCTLVPGGRGNIRITTGIKENGERQTIGGGGGTNDLNCTFDQNTVKITIPLWLIKAASPEIDWLLIATRLDTPPEIFSDTSIAFDTGEKRHPEQMPSNAIILDDPVNDTSIWEVKSNDGSITSQVQQIRAANADFTRIRAALTTEFLMLRVTYKDPLVFKPRYFTSITALVPGFPVKELFFSVNWSIETGGQIVLRDISSNPSEITKTRFLNQCVAKQGRDAFFLIPVTVFGRVTPPYLDLTLTAHEMIFKKSGAMGQTIKTAPRQNKGIIDRLPDKGFFRVSTDGV